MPASTKPLTYFYEITGPDGISHEVALSREHIGTIDSYRAANTPTPVFAWSYSIDGSTAHTAPGTHRSIAYEYARAKILGIRYVQQPHLGPVKGYVNVRAWHTVQDEMKANYRRREAGAGAGKGRG